MQGFFLPFFALCGKEIEMDAFDLQHNSYLIASYASWNLLSTFDCHKRGRR